MRGGLGRQSGGRAGAPARLRPLRGWARVSDGDYAAASGTLTFAAGETSGKIVVAVRGDERREGYEHFAVNLFNAGNAIIEDGRGVGTILDDDLR